MWNLPKLLSVLTIYGTIICSESITIIGIIAGSVASSWLPLHITITTIFSDPVSCHPLWQEKWIKWFMSHLLLSVFQVIKFFGPSSFLNAVFIHWRYTSTGVFSSCLSFSGRTPLNFKHRAICWQCPG